MAVGKFAWKCASFECAFAHDELLRLPRRFASTRSVERLANDLFTVGRILFKELREALVDGGLHNALDLCSAELCLGLAFKLRINEFHADHCSETFAHIFTSEIWIVIFHRAVLAAPLVE